MSLINERLWYLQDSVLPGALALLPQRMDSVEARAELLTIALHESGLTARLQTPKDVAHGFWQFEQGGGVTEVLTSPITRPLLLPICDLLLIDLTPGACWRAIVYQDVLACVFARLLLWLVPSALPLRTEPGKGYRQYLSAWKPNAHAASAHAKDWPAHFARAWAVAAGD
jgi:hypothetical protein